MFGPVIHDIRRDFFSSGSDLEGVYSGMSHFHGWGVPVTFRLIMMTTDGRMCLYYIRRQALPYMKSQVIKGLKKIFFHVKVFLLLIELL